MVEYRKKCATCTVEFITDNPDIPFCDQCYKVNVLLLSEARKAHAAAAKVVKGTQSSATMGTSTRARRSDS